jgi:hypothetical protein
VSSSPNPAALPLEEWIVAVVRRVLGTLRFGSITLVVHDGKVVQVETTAKVRLTASRTVRAR